MLSDIPSQVHTQFTDYSYPMMSYNCLPSPQMYPISPMLSQSSFALPPSFYASPLPSIVTIKQNLLQKLETFFTMITDSLNNNEKLLILIVDLDKSALFNFDNGYYSLPEDTNTFKYTEYTLFNNSNKIAQLLKVASILYDKCMKMSSSTKRELYYTDVELFKSTENIDSIINDLCSILVINRFELPIFPSAKGLFCGNISLYNEKGNQMNIKSTSYSFNKINLITYEYLTENFSVQIDNNINTFILIVEKETLFFNLIENTDFLNAFPNVILITGKGYPDYMTKVFIKKLSEQIKQRMIPLFYFGDNDPHGIEIFLNYLYGSKQSSRENESIAINSIKWIGLTNETIEKVSDTKMIIDSEKNAESSTGLIKLSPKDIKKIQFMKQREYFNIDNWVPSMNIYKENLVSNMSVLLNELNEMETRGYKAEGEYVLSKYSDLFIQNIKENLYS